MSIALSGNNANVTCSTTATIVAEPAGNTLVLWVAAFRSPSARTVSSIATTNVTWTQLCGTTNGTMDAEIWFGTVAGGNSGTTVTLTMSGTGATVIGRITGYSGVLTSGTIKDGTGVTNTGTSTSPSTAAYSATANSLALTCVGEASGTTPSANPGAPWTTITFNNSTTVVGVAGGYQLHASAGAQSAAWTIGNVAWVTCLGALKVAPKTSTLTASAATMDGAIAKASRKPISAAPGLLASLARTPLGTAAFDSMVSGSPTTVLSNITVNVGSTLLVIVAGFFAVGGPTTVTCSWAGNSMDADVEGGNPPTAIFRFSPPSNTTGTIVVTVDSTQGLAILASSLNAVVQLDISSSTSGSASGAGSDTAITTNVAAEVLFGVLHTAGPLTDAAATWGNSWSNGQRNGSSGSATNPHTAQEGFKVISALESSQAALTGIPGRLWTIMHASYYCLEVSFGGTMMRGRMITSSAQTMAGSIAKRTNHLLSSAMATWTVVYSAAKQGGSHAYTQSLAAATALYDAVLSRTTLWYRSGSMATAGATITKRPGKTIGASQMTFDGTITKMDEKVLTASMSTFDAAMMRGWLLLASLATFAATITRQTNKVLSASAATFSGAIMRGWILTASMATMAGTITRETLKDLLAAMATLDATLAASRATLQDLTASMATFSGNLIKRISKFFDAS